MPQQGQSCGQLPLGAPAVGGHRFVHVGFQVEAPHEVGSHLGERIPVRAPVHPGPWDSWLSAGTLLLVPTAPARPSALHPAQLPRGVGTLDNEPMGAPPTKLGLLCLGVREAMARTLGSGLELRGTAGAKNVAKGWVMCGPGWICPEAGRNLERGGIRGRRPRQQAFNTPRP